MVETPISEPIPLLRLVGVGRSFRRGAQEVAALVDVTLDIAAGEFIAFTGASGSGKSTLLNLLGCLDRPTTGEYSVHAAATSQLDADELAMLRNRTFGFVFQRYHLIEELSAGENVQLPALYAGMPEAQCRQRSRQLLRHLGLSERANHRPDQLSGGQQQRVAVARALMVGGSVILADEPTGALDAEAARETMRTLVELNARGHTLILVTHDPAVAELAHRVVELSDGRVIRDIRRAPAPENLYVAPAGLDKPGQFPAIGQLQRASRTTSMAFHAISRNRLRALLTVLSLSIGVASVLCMMAISDAANERVLKDLKGFGTNNIEVFPGKGLGDIQAGSIRTLVPEDAQALQKLSFVSGVSPFEMTAAVVRMGDSTVNVSVNGVGESYFWQHHVRLVEGSLFSVQDVSQAANYAIIDTVTRKRLFQDSSRVIGKSILLGRLPMELIGVVEKPDIGPGDPSRLTVFLPITTLTQRIKGTSNLQMITVRVADNFSTQAAEHFIDRFMVLRHGSKDFFLFNTDQWRRSIERSAQRLNAVTLAIASVSLVVACIGVMNMMLMSVAQRSREIGLRMAIGARRADIRQQFLAEAALLSFIGAISGVLLARAFGAVFVRLVEGLPLTFTASASLGAVPFSVLLGVLFGVLPAWRAAALDPAVALSGE